MLSMWDGCLCIKPYLSKMPGSNGLGRLIAIVRRYFHNIIKDKIRRLQLYRIKNHKRAWIQGDGQMSKATTRYFKKLFNLRYPVVNIRVIDYIPELIIEKEKQCSFWNRWLDGDQESCFWYEHSHYCRPW